MIEGTLKNGFKYQIEEEKLDDWEIIENLSDIENGKYYIIVDVARKILGDEQYNKLKDAVRTKEGKINTQDMYDAITELMSKNQDTKN